MTDKTTPRIVKFIMQSVLLNQDIVKKKNLHFYLLINWCYLPNNSGEELDHLFLRCKAT